MIFKLKNRTTLRGVKNIEINRLFRKEIKRFLRNKDYGFFKLLLNLRDLFFLRKNIKIKGNTRTIFKEVDGIIYSLQAGIEVEHQIIHEYFEEHIINILSKLIKKGDVCIDVGANCGFYTTLMGIKCGSKGHVYAFEPVDYNLKKINVNLNLNRLKNIKVMNKALGSVNAKLKMKVYPQNSSLTAHNSLIENPVTAEYKNFEEKEVDVITIDNFLEKENIKSVDIVKIDIECYEYNFFSGAKNLLKLKPIIIFEHNPEMLKFIGIDEVNFKVFFKDYDVYELLVDGLMPYSFDNTRTNVTDLIAFPKTFIN